jgi:hypothetical protein
MHIISYSQIGKIRLGLSLIAFLVFLFGAANLPAAHAQEGVTPTPTSIEKDPVKNDVPAYFSKITPTNGATIQGTKVTLEWRTAGTDITGYYHCVDKTNNGICDSNQWDYDDDLNRTLSNLETGSTYYWQIMACNPSACVGANSGQWWSFTIANLPAAHAQEGVTPTPTSFIEKDPVKNDVPAYFSKITPTNGASVLQGTKVTLEWRTAGTDITGYYHWVDNTNNGICDSNQWDYDDDLNRTLSNLETGSTYYWQIMACNSTACVGANSGQWWSFTIVPVYHVYVTLVYR